jgi:hypothetical protein
MRPPHPLGVAATCRGWLLALVLPGLALHPQDRVWEEYRPARLDQLVGLARGYRSRQQKYRIPCRYAGRIRPISATASLCIRDWQRSQVRAGVGKAVEGFEALFLHEICVKDGDSEAWLPIQEPLLRPFRNGFIEAQEAFVAYVFRAGSSQGHVIYTINRIEVPPETEGDPPDEVDSTTPPRSR